MTEDPCFITLDDALLFHEQEIRLAGGLDGIRDLAALEASLDAPKAAFGGAFLLDLFEMAATYVESISTRHPFLDGNKRTATASALAFLYLNGYELVEKYDEELADKVLDLVCHRIDKGAMADYFKSRSQRIM